MVDHVDEDGNLVDDDDDDDEDGGNLVDHVDEDSGQEVDQQDAHGAPAQLCRHLCNSEKVLQMEFTVFVFLRNSP